MNERDEVNTLTINEIKLTIDNALLEQERRMTENFRAAISDWSKDFATREQLLAVDQKHATRNKEQDSAIKSLEDWNTWAVRIVVGAVILAGVGFILSNKV